MPRPPNAIRLRFLQHNFEVYEDTHGRYIWIFDFIEDAPFKHEFKLYSTGQMFDCLNKCFKMPIFTSTHYPQIYIQRNNMILSITLALAVAHCFLPKLPPGQIEDYAHLHHKDCNLLNCDVTNLYRGSVKPKLTTFKDSICFKPNVYFGIEFGANISHETKRQIVDEVYKLLKPDCCVSTKQKCLTDLKVYVEEMYSV